MSSNDGAAEASALDTSHSAYKPSLQQLSSLRREWESDQDNIIKRFTYATMLVLSPQGTDRREAVIHLDFLLAHINREESAMAASEVNKSAEQITAIECSYNLSLAYYALEDYSRARTICEAYYKEYPDSSQLRTLHKAIVYKAKVRQRRLDDEAEAAVQTAAVGALAVGAAALVLGLLFSGGGKK